jgi:pimeloyl-ACP methyl ester carboxylesterase
MNLWPQSAVFRRGARRSWLGALSRLIAFAVVVIAAPAQAAATTSGLDFADCDLLDQGGVPRAQGQCASMVVPENPAVPAARRITLRIARIEAQVPGLHDDPVVLLAGGPGQSAIDAYLNTQVALRRLNRERDILLVDQRGTGGSNRLACDEPDDIDAAPADAAQWRSLAEACRKTLEQNADLRFYTTSDYIADLERVRAALGAPRFNLIGGSYGTRVAQEYLRRHPDAIRSVVLDGVVPPTLAMPGEHAQNFEDALRKIFARCAADTACAQRHGDLSANLKAAQQRLDDDSSKQAYADAIDYSPKSGSLSRDALSLLIRLYAYQPESAALLPMLVSAAAAGRDAPLLAQVDQLSQGLGDQLAHGMELSVLCSEDAPRLQPRPEDANTLLGKALVDGALAQCSVWPRGEVPANFAEPLVSDAPALLLSGEFDPVTPPRYAEQVLRTLSQGRHLVAPGQAHIVMTRGCMPKLVKTFIDTLDATSLDASCVDVMGPTPAFLDYNGFGP